MALSVKYCALLAPVVVNGDESAAIAGLAPVAAVGSTLGQTFRKVDLEFVSGHEYTRKKVSQALVTSSEAATEQERRAEAWEALKDVDIPAIITPQDIAKIHAGVVPESVFLLREIPAEFVFKPPVQGNLPPDGDADQEACPPSLDSAPPISAGANVTMHWVGSASATSKTRRLSGNRMSAHLVRRLCFSHQTIRTRTQGAQPRHAIGFAACLTLTQRRAGA